MLLFELQINMLNLINLDFLEGKILVGCPRISVIHLRLYSIKHLHKAQILRENRIY